jgi:hypothetical protein
MAMRYYAPFPGGGDPYRPRGFHVLRIGDAERDAAVADLAEHYTAGRLTLDELHERLSAAFAAKTYGQLAQIMADLPGPGRLAALAAASRPAVPPRPREHPTSTDRAGRFAALSLLILAMLIWLFTALLFARHGIDHQVGPMGPMGPGRLPGDALRDDQVPEAGAVAGA